MDLPVRRGQIFADKYRLEGPLGSGAMGTVVKAQHLILKTYVAIKFLSGVFGTELIARFIQEAQSMAKLRSSNIARVTDAGVDGGLPYIVMEFLAGEDLESRMNKAPRLPVEKVIDYVREACTGLQEAHTNGIIHRDLKPANLFLALNEDLTTMVKLIDFGIVKMLSLPDATERLPMTSAGTLLGTPQYMPPEQWNDPRFVDARSDIWSLGVILYRGIAGAMPFPQQDVGALRSAIANEQPKSVRSYNPEVPAELEAVILRCLEKDPKQRFHSVAELAKALLPFGRLAPTSLPIPIHLPAPPAPPPWLAIVVASSLMLLAMGALWLHQAPERDARRAPSVALVTSIEAPSPSAHAPEPQVVLANDLATHPVRRPRKLVPSMEEGGRAPRGWHHQLWRRSIQASLAPRRASSCPA